MNIIFMRHGEAVDNVRGVLSCKEIRCSVLTEAGFCQVAKSVSRLPREIDKIYSSPLIRTLQTAKEIMKASGAEVIIDNRIREIDWGEFEEFSDIDFSKLDEHKDKLAAVKVNQ